MKSVHNLAKVLAFLRLKGQQRVLIFQALFLGSVIRVALWVLPFDLVRRRFFLSNNFSKKKQGTRPTQSVTLEEMIWAIEVAIHLVPHKTCLVKALAAHILLSRRGYPTQLRIGVAKDVSGRFLAHAWVEHNEKIIIGGEAQNYQVLSTWES